MDIAPAQDQAARERKKVALLVYDGIGFFHLAGPLMVFSDHGLAAAPVEFALFALEPGPVRTVSGFIIEAPHGLECLAQADVILISGWLGEGAAVPPGLRDALRAAHRRGAQLAGLCLGSFVLAEAGLLHGRRATTHWSRAAAFARRFPHVRFDPDILYVQDGNIWTSAGGVAAIDLCLLLLKRLAGAVVADQVAARLVSGLLRQGEQLQCVDSSFPLDDGSRRLQRLLEWMRAHPQDSQRLDTLAARMHMSVRTFTRRFRQLTGLTVVQWRLRQQLGRAQQLLESTSQSIERVAVQSGFGSAPVLRRHFKALSGISPTEYRKRWRRGSASRPGGGAQTDGVTS